MSILFLDGGLGTSLEQKYEQKFTPSTPLWSSHLLVSNPPLLLQCQADFGLVPVDILLTATYQVSVEGFRKTRTPSFPDGIPAQHIPAFLETAVSVAERASSRASVALSLGPYGACMVPSQEYSGRYDPRHSSPDALYEWHRERLLLFARVDGLARRVGYVAMETVPRVDEVAAMRRALGAVPQLAGLPFWVSCLYPGDGEVLPTGESVEQVLRASLDAGVAGPVPWGVGINCTKVWKLPSLLARYEAAVADMVRQGVLAAWPALVLYPDGTNGQVYNTATQAWEGSDAADVERGAWEEQLAEVVRGTRARGEWKQVVVGGCCMASSEDISRLRQILLADTANAGFLPRG
ncbi:uncharacterized protein UV8b_01855 [Ustilaginoidea virens]|uniref:Hcy-binding domain-containing protein n=1 Tax=Ustilaginoidea virens TaxID=1159556 RepID=A0A063BX82_USTVR|nr:uncharacterized protein UV8b_01855 [Ustilaginoidea virens]QUC17614.1 hypothetical protein UV8b_01855 [Ustilaginoidea virens]GAO14054.1 hypothetical protein UVI_02036030 [Ustilaginoidea virens]